MTAHNPIYPDEPDIDYHLNQVHAWIDGHRAPVSAHHTLLRAITDTTSDLIIDCDASGLIEFVSKSISQLGYRDDQLIGADVAKWVAPDDVSQLRGRLTQPNSTDVTQDVFHFIASDGVQVPMDCRFHRLHISSESESRVLLVARDITQSLRWVKTLQESVAEKDVLLKEIHHRVKNNLQIISSMLNIQSHYFGDPAVREVFRECQNRIKSMALIHETLYMSKNLAQIEFSTYMTTLVNRLVASYRERSSWVSVHVDVPPQTLHIDVAIACGLIVTELVTNALKYAFPDQSTGDIWVSFTPRDHQYALTVKDNGVGFPKDIDLAKANSMGLQLVTTLAHQLDADLELDKWNGVSVTVVFSDHGAAT